MSCQRCGVPFSGRDRDETNTLCGFCNRKRMKFTNDVSDRQYVHSGIYSGRFIMAISLFASITLVAACILWADADDMEFYKRNEKNVITCTDILDFRRDVVGPTTRSLLEKRFMEECYAKDFGSSNPYSKEAMAGLKTIECGRLSQYYWYIGWIPNHDSIREEYEWGHCRTR